MESQKYDDAIKSYQSAFENAKDNESRAKVFHNVGNSLLKSNKIEESVEAYKNALKFNPNDQDTKYNLSYALELLKNKDKNKQDKNDQNKNDQNKQNQQQQQTGPTRDDPSDRCDRRRRDRPRGDRAGLARARCHRRRP